MVSNKLATLLIISSATLAALLAVGVGYMHLLLSAYPVAVPPYIPIDSPIHAIPPWYIYRPGVAVLDWIVHALQTMIPPKLLVMDMAISFWKSEILYALTKNHILDTVGVTKHSNTRGKTCTQVATELNLVEHPVCELMQAGAKLNLLDVVSSDKDGIRTYSLSHAGELLQSSYDDNDSLRDFTLFMNEWVRMASRSVSLDSIRTGQSGIKAATGGKELWEYFHEFPEQGSQFDRALALLSHDAMGAILSSWQPIRPDVLFCDIGGGVGAAAAIFLQHYPEATAIVFDQPDTIVNAQTRMEELGLASRTRTIGGSFFEPFPSELAACDVYFMKAILHDWPDKEAITILKNIKTVASGTEQSPTKKKAVVVAEQVLDIGKGFVFDIVGALFSITMMAANPMGAKERTLAEYSNLFSAAGYDRVAKLTLLRDPTSILEVDIVAIE